jgi:trans-aconitate 2-methyltransferase
LSSDSWDPAQYERFSDERSAPFFDLLALVEPCPEGSVIDLGCGTGELTRVLHERTSARTTLGIDSSESMLAQSKGHAGGGLSFELGDIAGWEPAEPVDVVFSNAALHWVDGHAELFVRLTGALREGGQLTVQMPANHDHASHLVAERVAAEEPFREVLDGYVRKTPVLRPEEYAVLLDQLDYVAQHVRMQVYLHLLPEAGAVVEWIKGTLLTDYKRRLESDVFEDFVERYRELLLEELGEERPFPFTFKRVLLWAKRP